MQSWGVFSRIVAVFGLFGWMGLAGLRASETEPGDLDGSGGIDAMDLTLLANFQAGNLAPLPATYGYLFEADPIVGVLRFVPAGTFTQGSPVDEPCRTANEAQFTHTLTRDLAVMATEVTRRMWADLRAVQPSLPADPTHTGYGAGMTNPVQCVSWYEAVLFANLLSLQRGLTRCYYVDAGFNTPIDATNHTTGPFYCNRDASGYRLPTEGEWEWFCRAGTTTPFWIEEPNYTVDDCGSSTPGQFPALESADWFWDNSSSLNSTSPVGMKTANPWGLYDVHGNVAEWCWDWYDTYPSGSLADYEGGASGPYRVDRGGRWSYMGQYCRSAFRGLDTPDFRLVSLGFRLVRTAP